MKTTYTTGRLTLKNLTLQDADFIFELVNTAGWIKYIGDRNVQSTADAVNYIKKILNNPDVTYWVVHITDDKIPVGIVTLIKRDYLPHHDIGFAFLPAFNKQGFAYEAANIVLHDLIRSAAHTTLLATTIKGNIPSVHLLKKLGFSFQKEMINGNDLLDVYVFTK